MGLKSIAALYAGLKPRKGAPAPTDLRTPGTFAGGLYNPGNPLSIGNIDAPDSGYTPQQIQEAKLTANPPREGYKEDGTKIGGLRRVLGTIASTVGPMIGGPAVAGLGDKLLYPGRDKYNSDLARAQRLSALSVDARNHQDLQANRKILENEHTAAQKARDENSYFQRISNNENHGALELPEAPSPVDLPMNKQVAGPSGIQKIQSTTPVTPPEIDPVTGKPVSEAGTVDTVEGTGNLPKKRFMRYNANTQRDLAIKKKKEELDATRTEEFTPDLIEAAKAMKMTGLPAPGKVTPAVHSNFMTAFREQERQNNKPAGAPTAEGEKIKYQAIGAKLAAEGLVSGAAITDSRQMLVAIQKSKTLTPEEKNGAIAYLASNTTPAGQGANATIRVEGMGENNLRSVVDTKNNNTLQYLNVNDINKANAAEPGRYLEAGNASKALKPAALMEDIRGSIGNLRNSLMSIPEFTGQDKVLIATAMRGTSPSSAVSALLNGAAANHLTPEQQEYLINLAQLHEQALAMRPMLGAGQGSDDLRAAIARTIPGPSTPNRAYAAKQLDAFEQTLNRLGRGLVTVPLREDKTAAIATPATNAPPKIVYVRGPNGTFVPEKPVKQ